MTPHLPLIILCLKNTWTRKVRQADVYDAGCCAGRPLDFLGYTDRDLDCDGQIVDKYVAASRLYHRGYTGHSRPFFNPECVLDITCSAFNSTRHLYRSYVAFMLRDRQ